jgi:23S rRNA pseudouridine1911/1915/1917 synthase
LETADRDKLFLINDRLCKKGDRLKAGDVLAYQGPGDWLHDTPHPDARRPLNVAYEDESVLVVDKPAGMATHGFSARDRNTLANLLLASRPALMNIGNSRWQPGLVHRLDTETSGLVLVAKTQSAFEHLRLQFRGRRVEKKYWALVWGTPVLEGEVAYPLAHDPGDKRRMKALCGSAKLGSRQKAWAALTHFRKLSEINGLSLVEIRMSTGVTHQIRVHLATIGHPIVGDLLYGPNRRERFGLERHFLHAFCLKFSHPEDDRLLQVESRLPADLRAVLGRLCMLT